MNIFSLSRFGYKKKEYLAVLGDALRVEFFKILAETDEILEIGKSILKFIIKNKYQGNKRMHSVRVMDIHQHFIQFKNEFMFLTNTKKLVS